MSELPDNVAELVDEIPVERTVHPTVVTVPRGAMNNDQAMLAIELVKERCRHVWEARKAGETFKDIAKRLGITPAQASVDFKSYALFLYEEEYIDIVRQKTVDADRIEDMIISIWNRAVTGDMVAMDMVLKLQTRKAKLLGLDRPTKFEHEIVNRNRPKQTMAQEEVDRRLMELYKRMKDRGVPISPLFQEWAIEKQNEGKGEV